jgi:hypothetical protein
MTSIICFQLHAHWKINQNNAITIPFTILTKVLKVVSSNITMCCFIDNNKLYKSSTYLAWTNTYNKGYILFAIGGWVILGRINIQPSKSWDGHHHWWLRFDIILYLIKNNISETKNKKIMSWKFDSNQFRWNLKNKWPKFANFLLINTSCWISIVGTNM